MARREDPMHLYYNYILRQGFRYFAVKYRSPRGITYLEYYIIGSLTGAVAFSKITEASKNTFKV